MKASKPKGWMTFLRMLARDAKLKFAVGSPATDGKTVWLPALPLELNEEDLILFKGDSFHEVGHIQFSDINFFMKFAEQGPAHRFLLNAVDDVFMEGRSSSWKKMAETYIRKSTVILIKRKQFIDGSQSLVQALGAFCLVYLTSKRWPEIGEPLPVIVKNLEMHLAQHASYVIPKLTELLDTEFPNVTSTRDAGALVLKMIDLLNNLAEQDQPSSDPKPPAEDDKGDGEGSEPDNGSEGEEADGESSTDNSNPEDSDDEPSQGGDSDEGNEAGSKGGDQEGDESNEAGNGTGGKGKPESSDEPNGSSDDNGSSNGQNQGQPNSGDPAPTNNGKSLSEMVQEMLGTDPGTDEIFDKAKAVLELSESIKNGENPQYKGATVISELEMNAAGGIGPDSEFLTGLPEAPRDRQAYMKLKSSMVGKSGKAANKLRRLLLNRMENEVYSTRNGRLSDRHLYRFGLGDSRLFEKSEERYESTAAVSIAADLSGSTIRPLGNEGRIAHEIQKSLLMLETVLNDIGTPREIFGFAPRGGELNSVIRTFKDNHMVACERIGGMLELVGGSSTPIGEAVLQAAQRLVSHESKRKLLFVVTDGIPSNLSKAVSMTELAASQGVQVIYFVIDEDEGGSRWLEEHKLQYINITKPGQLLEAFAEKMTEFLA